MNQTKISGIHQQPEIKNKTAVFKDRHHAGMILGEMLEPFPLENGIVFGIPAGGVPVGLAVAGRLELPLD
ncbi:MAG: phosphoribosyltransferase, partial [Chitinivibrionales bacterium]|nr:phosphoribosyltransferase [Chitinivibrionales bacterium]